MDKKVDDGFRTTNAEIAKINAEFPPINDSIDKLKKEVAGDTQDIASLDKRVTVLEHAPEVILGVPFEKDEVSYIANLTRWIWDSSDSIWRINASTVGDVVTFIRGPSTAKVLVYGSKYAFKNPWGSANVLIGQISVDMNKYNAWIPDPPYAGINPVLNSQFSLKIEGNPYDAFFNIVILGVKP